MLYVDVKEYAQLFPDKFKEVMKTGGWENFLSYRARNKNKFAEVKLFRSYGSDRQWRHLGMAFGYDTDKSFFSDRRIVTEGAPLGLLKQVIEGEHTRYKTQTKPLDEDFGLQLYINGTMIRERDYELDYVNGTVLFKRELVKDGDIVTADFKLGSDAPEPPSYLIFFTFNSVHLKQLIGSDAPIQLADGDGVTKVYPLPSAPVRFGTLNVYTDGNLMIENEDYTCDYTTGIITFIEAPSLGKEITVKYEHLISGMSKVRIDDGDGTNKEFYTPNAPVGTTGFKVYVNGQLQRESDYTIEYTEGKITFVNAPTLGAEVTVEYLDLTGGYPAGETVVENDIKINKNFDVEKPQEVMNAVYSSLDYIVPSLPTVLDFTSNSKFGGSWQRDSYIYLWGNINKDRATLLTRPDPTGDAEAALFSPLFFGRLRGLSVQPRKNMVLASGCSSQREIVYKKDINIGGMPVDYGVDTSNGNRGVILAQGLGGAYYQPLYLKFFTYSKYADNGDGKFNPSRYSKKHHFSFLKLTHPYDGDVGWMDDTLAIHPKNIYNDNEVEIEKKIEGELLGHGNERQLVYHLRHEPFEQKFKVFVGCEEVPETDYEYEEDTKAIVFKQTLPIGEEITATYEISHKYRYNLPTAAISAWTLEQFSPYWPIGIGVLVDGQNPKKTEDES